MYELQNTRLKKDLIIKFIEISKVTNTTSFFLKKKQLTNTCRFVYS